MAHQGDAVWNGKPVDIKHDHGDGVIDIEDVFGNTFCVLEDELEEQR